ncbi:DJ-1/PfpI family protein [Altibacter sp. HG106]|uniref:DJ-1/PfpI family protein n=1 Tax=Altibacter sp. HG106 TaxID=3023937 RepID=UPI002350B74A|nr:DJ-1/PfpI family protein [Altibacter sp. HG106]MDC7995785.1 DJ-1/PfpI family protein [Altibacter sp. HG106]
MKALKWIWLLSLVVLSFGSTSCQHKNVETKKNTVSEATQDSTQRIPKKRYDSTHYQVAFLLMDGVYNTELTAPYDIFQHTKFREGIKPMDVFTVANTLKPITSFEGLRLLPDYNYRLDSLPPIDILVVPSAEHHLDADLEDDEMLNFVKKIAEEAAFITSHCDGAFVLAQAGLLEGRVATTFPTDTALMQQKFPNVDVREEVLWVHDGKFITSAGGARSFEAALYLCEFLYGKEIARSLASGLVIDWDVDDYPHLVIGSPSL